jgi:hypothetical protein
VHGKEFIPVEQRDVDIRRGFRNVVSQVMRVTKSVCPEPECGEVVFSDQYGVVIDGVKTFPKDARLVWTSEGGAA